MTRWHSGNTPMTEETAAKAILCPNGHHTIDGSTTCDVCSLPVIDCSAEINQVFRRLADRTDLITKPITESFIGLGTGGKRILQDLYVTYGNVLPDNSYLVIDSLDKPDMSFRTASPLVHYYRIGHGLAEGLTYCGLAEQAAMGDRLLDHHLRRGGIRKADPRQSVVLVGGVGGGTASGTTAHVMTSCRSINPEASMVALLVMPSVNDADNIHFNALYGISNLLYRNSRPNTGMIWLVNYDKLSQTRGIGRSGEELTSEGLLSHLMYFLGLVLAETGLRHMIRLSQGMNIQAFVPCLAIGRSMEIFGSLPNVLESAVIFPLVKVDMEHVMASYLLLRVPGRLSDNFSHGRVAEEFYAWNKRHMPAVRTSIVQVVHSEERSDRVDACVLLGGDLLATSIGDTLQGFRRFRASMEESAQWETCGLSREKVLEAEKVVGDYDKRMQKLLASQVDSEDNPT